MATFTITVAPGYDFPPGVPIGLDELRAAAKPTITITGAGLEALDNVSATLATTTGQALVWNQTTQKWEPSGTVKIRNQDLGLMVGATGATDGQSGAVAAPLIANRRQFWRGDGVWADPVFITTGPDLFNYFNYY